MSNNVPRKLSDLIPWCATHVTLWELNYASIGMTSGESTAFKNNCEAMTLAASAAEDARTTSKNATMTQNDTIAVVRASAGSLIARIKGFAENTSDPGVYPAAGITPDAPPSPAPPPNPPTQFFASVNPDGSLNISFKASQPTGLSGVMYKVFRRFPSGSSTPPAFAYLETCGRSKRITDMTIPFGTDRVEYMVIPQRGEVMGAQSAVFALQFGSVAGGGGFSINRTFITPHEQPMKVAA